MFSGSCVVGKAWGMFSGGEANEYAACCSACEIYSTRGDYLMPTVKLFGFTPIRLTVFKESSFLGADELNEFSSCVEDALN
jgi:hypothetical protein